MTKNEDLLLTSEDRKKAIDWFNHHIKLEDGTERGCHICGKSNSVLHEHIFSPQVYNLKKNQTITDKILPSVMVECMNCGAMTYFSAPKIGIKIADYMPKTPDEVAKDGD